MPIIMDTLSYIIILLNGLTLTSLEYMNIVHTIDIFLQIQ